MAAIGFNPLKAASPHTTTFLPLTTASDIAEILHSFREINSTTHCIDYSTVSELSLYPIPVEEGITTQTRQRSVVIFGVFKQIDPISHHANLCEMGDKWLPQKGSTK